MDRLTPVVGPPWERLVDEVGEAIRGDVSSAGIAAIVGRTAPGAAELGPWISFSPEGYVRRRLHVDPFLEVVLIAWDVRQQTPIHDHGGQRGWLTVLDGELLATDYAKAGGGDESAVVALETTRLVAGAAVPETVDREAIHSVGAPEGRAVSLHVYSHPLSEFRTYVAAKGRAGIEP